MQPEEPTDPHIYRIGAVSRLTSIPTGTIRVWERRYGVVEPGRSDGGFRLYSHRDVERLRVIKSLIENGETISGLASLTLAQLKQRLRAHGIAAPEPLQHPLEVAFDDAALADATVGDTVDNVDMRISARPAAIAPLANGARAPHSGEQLSRRAVVAGQSLSVAMRMAATSYDDLELVGSFSDWREHDAEIARLRPDLLVIEQSSIHVETADEIKNLVRTSGARRMLIVYQFGSEAALRSLESDRITPVKGPLNATQLQLALRLSSDRNEPSAEPERSQRFIEMVDRRPPPARFDPATIARIASQSRVVHCECPQHLATLISSLMAFEAYCKECEHRSDDDAALHSSLERATGQARATLEDALEYLIQVENIDV